MEDREMTQEETNVMDCANKKLEGRKIDERVIVIKSLQFNALGFDYSSSFPYSSSEETRDRKEHISKIADIAIEECIEELRK